jgi:MoaA/NifB/PqqE/SkfB family radical SAM enzyme
MLRYTNLASNILKSNYRRLAFPYKLTFVTTYWCNYKCKTCNIWHRKPKDELRLAEINRFFERSNRFNWIDFTGGEVWLRKDFPEIVEAALDNCKDLVLVHFPTNGYFTDRIVAGVERILQRKPRKLIVTVSIDGDEKVNDEVRGKQGGWKRQIETYKRLHTMTGVEVVLGMTLSSFNVDEYDRAFAAAKTECPWLTPRDYHINIAHESHHYYGNAGTPALRGKTEKLAQQLRRYRLARGISKSIVDYLEHQYLRNAENYLQNGKTPMRCHALRSSVFIDSWGDVYPCGMYDAKIASLRDFGYDLSAVWNLPRTSTLQQEIWEYKCPQCWTPCEAYQTILGNLFGQTTTAG